MNSHDIDAVLPLLTAALLLAPTALHGLAAWRATRAGEAAGAWRFARGTSLTAFAAAVAAVGLGLAGVQVGGPALRLDVPGGALLVLVTAIGAVIVRYSATALAGEREEAPYLRWLATALAAVGLVVVTNHLLVLALAWIGTSLALHRLLTFFGERRAAQVAAHKKFLVARAADILMLASVGAAWVAFGTLRIDELLQAATTASSLPWMAHLAMLLIALAAVLKCAQLPFHGWLIQVMEAPTPVSALLHAGVVNLGGFVLIRFAPLLAQVPAAQAVLVVAGASTAVLAALVMTTRISVKVRLAWSTCAQMGFMLMQCGLGLPEMALLHLLAHSLYKAHAFLTAGDTVRSAMTSRLNAAPVAGGVLRWLLAGALAVALVACAAALVRKVVPATPMPPALMLMAGIVAVALLPMLVRPFPGPVAAGRAVGGASALALAYFGGHAAAAAALPAMSAPAPWPLVAFAVLAFAGLAALQIAIATAPHGPLAQRLYPWFYGGLFLDEVLTRLLFRRWPPPEPRMAPTAPINVVPVETTP